MICLCGHLQEDHELELGPCIYCGCDLAHPVPRWFVLLCVGLALFMLYAVARIHACSAPRIAAMRAEAGELAGRSQ